MEEKSASEQIDDIIELHCGWKADVLRLLRATVTGADPKIIEEVKWKTPSRPEGLPVWSYNGIVCFAEIWKDNIKLIFFQGAKLTDTNKVFNSRLKSATLRALEIHEGDDIDDFGIQALIAQAVELNAKKTKRSTP